MTNGEPEPRVLRNDEQRRYEVWVGDELAGFSAYREPDDGSERTIFTHTEIDPAHGGRGLGSRLVRHALDDTVGRGRQIVPICPFVTKVLRSASGYEEYVRWPEESRE